jgi:hypothetical protein
LADEWHRILKCFIHNLAIFHFQGFSDCPMSDQIQKMPLQRPQGDDAVLASAAAQQLTFCASSVYDAIGCSSLYFNYPKSSLQENRTDAMGCSPHSG